jgi:uncharacterized protein DUF1566
MRCCLGRDWNDFSCEGDSTFFTWQEALDAVKKLNKNGGFSGFDDWRLANIDELKDINKKIPPDNMQGTFPEIRIKSCWSSSLIENSTFAWCIDHYSNIDRDFTYKYFNAYLVRNIKSDTQKATPHQYSYSRNKYNIFGASFSKNEIANLILIIGFPCLYFLLISLGYIENSYFWLLAWGYLISVANQSENDLKNDHDLKSGSNINSNYDSWSDRSIKDKQKNSFSKRVRDQDYSKYTRYASTHFSKAWLFYFLAAIFAYFYIFKPDWITTLKPSERVKAYSKPSYIRPHAAPNGIEWPAVASYLSGYPKLNTGGLSSITIDNRQNDSDVFVKLVSLDSTKPLPVRYFFIPAYGQFTLTLITAGKYDIRYRDLNSGGFARSETFTLSETETYTGIQYSNISMTLYKVAHGNMHTFSISETEF